MIKIKFLIVFTCGTNQITTIEGCSISNCWMKIIAKFMHEFDEIITIKIY